MKPTYTLHKLPEGFIITSSEVIFDEDLQFSERQCIFSKGDVPYGDTKKVIAQQDQIDFSSLSEEQQREIGWFDVEKLALNYASDFIKDKVLIDLQVGAYVEGFQKAQELITSDRKFTKQELLNYPNWCSDKGYSYDSFYGWNHPNGHRPNNSELMELYTQSLSQKSWKIELEMELNLNGRNGLERASFIPKLTNGKIKILNIL
jgi:hypothetical protein